MKCAYCIIANRNPELFRNLISQIDYPGNSIFVMIDAKSNIESFKNVSTNWSEIYFLSERINIKWGAITQPMAEMTLFQSALDKEHFDYIHLLSGVDMLLKHPKEINDFLEKNAGKEFIELKDYNLCKYQILKRLQYYYFFPQWARNSNKMLGIIHALLLRIQYFFGISKRLNFQRITQGSNWVTITSEFAKYICSHKADVLRIFRYSCCSDEIYKQWIFLNSPFCDNAFMSNGAISSNLRAIDWCRGNPYTWENKDIEELLDNPNFFARKIAPDANALIKRLLSLTSSQPMIEG